MRNVIFWNQFPNMKSRQSLLMRTRKMIFSLHGGVVTAVIAVNVANAAFVVAMVTAIAIGAIAIVVTVTVVEIMQISK